MVGLQLRHKGILGAVLTNALSVLPQQQHAAGCLHEGVGGGSPAAGTATNGNSNNTNSSALRHFIITPSNALVTTSVIKPAQARSQKRASTAAPSATTGHDNGNSIIRIEDLSGDMLSVMLKMAINMTSREKSYTIHAVPHNRGYCDGWSHGGDGGGNPSSACRTPSSASPSSDASAVASTADPAFTNEAILHIVGRFEGDLPINNLIYTNLIKKCSIVHELIGEEELTAAAEACHEEGEDEKEEKNKTKALLLAVLKERNRILSGAATLEHPQPNKDLFEDSELGAQRRQIVEEEEGRTPDDDLLLSGGESDAAAGGGGGMMISIGGANSAGDCSPSSADAKSPKSEGGSSRRATLSAAATTSNSFNHIQGSSSSLASPTTAIPLRLTASFRKQNTKIKDAVNLAHRRAFTAFVQALQADVRIGDADLPFLPSQPIGKTSIIGGSVNTSGKTPSSISPEEATRNNCIEIVADPNRPPPPHARTFYFWPYKCDYRSSICYESAHFVVMVNLKPITEGHLMVVPKRVMTTIHSLNNEEVGEWGFLIKHCCLVLKKVYGGTSCATGNNNKRGISSISLAIQQGKCAGQTVPHLHTHVIAYREEGELDGEPEPEEQEQMRRRPRTNEEMQVESDAMRKAFIEMEAIVGDEGVLFNEI